MKIVLSATIALFVGAIVFGALSAEGADAKPAQEYVVSCRPSPLPVTALRRLLGRARESDSHDAAPTGSSGRAATSRRRGRPAARSRTARSCRAGSQPVTYRDSSTSACSSQPMSAIPWARSRPAPSTACVTSACAAFATPCFSIRASRLNSRQLDAGLRGRPDERRGSRRNRRCGRGAPSSATVSSSPAASSPQTEGGRVFRASRIYLRATAASRLSTSQARRTSSSVVRKFPIASRSA